MSLRGIVRALGGEIYDGGFRANIPPPGRSAEDRSVSLLLQGDQLVVHTFGAGNGKAVLDQLRERQLIDAHNSLLDGPGRPVGGRPVGEAAPARERPETALRLWEDGRPLGQTLSARHCRLRGWAGDLPGPEALRHHGEVPVSVYRPGRLRRPVVKAYALSRSMVTKPP